MVKSDIVMLSISVGISIGVGFLLGCYSVSQLQIWEIDLSRVVAVYSREVAQTNTSNQRIIENFKESFAQVVKQLPDKVILVNKGQILSEHLSLDKTTWFLEQMEANHDKQNQESDPN